MSVTIAFCPTCQRDVHLAGDESLTCPVCSAALIPNVRTTGSHPATLPAEAFVG